MTLAVLLTFIFCLVTVGATYRAGSRTDSGTGFRRASDAREVAGVGNEPGAVSGPSADQRTASKAPHYSRPIDYEQAYHQLVKRHARLLKVTSRIERQRNDLKRMLLHGWTMREAIQVSAITFNVSVSTLTRRMFCESHGYRYAHNASGATSYWQFLPSTWASTPYGSLSIYSPFGQAMAAGWMMGPAGRGGEWSCR